MSGAAAIMKNQRVEIDVAALIAAALQKKEEEKAARFALAEQTPEGEVLTWKVTPEQIARINDGDRAALDAFFLNEDNYCRIRAGAWQFMRNNAYLKSVISYEDLINQFYVELLTGMVKLRPWDRAIGRAEFTAFRYAAVGGLDDLYIPYDKEHPTCQKQAN